MADFPALPLWTDAFLADTMHLGREEIGVYMLLLMTAWRRPTCDLPDDDVFLAKIARCDGRKWRHLRPLMATFHTVENGRWTQKRLQKERKYVDDLSEKQRQNVNARWSKNKDLHSTTVIPNAYQTDTPTPTPIPKEESPLLRNGGRKPFAKPKRAIPDGFPSTPDLQWATDFWLRKGRADLCTAIADENAKFRDHHTANDTRSADWSASWRTWAQNALRYNNGGHSARSNQQTFLAGVEAAIRGPK